MDEKKEICKRCGTKITPKTKRAEFCSPKCKVYWHRENPKVTLKNFNEKNKEVKLITDPPPKTNYTINTRPKNLIELKELCPFKEIGDERSAWVATERQKYNI